MANFRKRRLEKLTDENELENSSDSDPTSKPSTSKEVIETEKSQKKDKPTKKDLDETSEPEKKHNITKKKIVIRIGLCCLVILLVYIQTLKKPKAYAPQNERIQLKTHEVKCSEDYQKELTKFPGCVPTKCGRVVTDEIITTHESYELLQLAKKGLTFGGGLGGASILDIHTGALSQGNHFVNIYKLMKEKEITSIFSHNSFEIYRGVKNKIQRMIAMHFGLRVQNIYLTQPTFFSRLMNIPAKTKHDEYWHTHVDKDTYESFHYTSLLYLSDYEQDFTGGRFNFVDENRNMTIEPKIGRVLAFTSGSENPHAVEKVASGMRFALTVSFTCNKTLAIPSPTVRKLQ